MSPLAHAPLRRGLTVLAVAAAAGVVPATASAAPAYGYVWANQPTASSYTPSTTYQANTTGLLNTITRSGVGQYEITFPGLARAQNGGTVNVTAYGAGGRSYCGVVGWGSTSAGAIIVTVRCTDTTGAPVDSLFDATYAVAPRKGALAYVWANQPTNASYTPSLFYQFNSKGFTNTITRSATGVYTVHLPGLGAAAGTVKVTAYGGGSNRCKVSGWGPSGTTQLVGVLCFNAAGAPVDSFFTLTYARNRNLLGTRKGYGYAWANQPTSASYSPSSAYARTKPLGPITITRSGVGIYTVLFSNVGTALKSDVQVTAYGGGSSECRVRSWGPSGSGQAVGVECYDTNGNATDTFYTIQFIR